MYWCSRSMLSSLVGMRWVVLATHILTRRRHPLLPHVLNPADPALHSHTRSSCNPQKSLM